MSARRGMRKEKTEGKKGKCPEHWEGKWGWGPQ